MSTLKPYMFYSAHEGPEEGAALVFARTAKEAKVLGWKKTDIAYDFFDARATLIRNSDYLFDQTEPEKIRNDIPHVIQDPIGCSECNM